MKSANKGFTLIELLVGVVLSLVVVLSVANVIADSQKGYNDLYNKAYSDTAFEEAIMDKVFASVIRQACQQASSTTLDENGQWIEVQYYSSTDTENLDRYAKFYKFNKELVLEKGIVEPRQTLSLQTLCENVESVEFTKVGSSAQIFLQLDDGIVQRTVTVSAVMQNP